MGTGQEDYSKCSICGECKHPSEFTIGEAVREPVALEIRREHPNWSPSLPTCLECVNKFRAEHFRHLLEEEKGELSSLEEQVIESLSAQEAISSNINEQFDQQLAFGQRLSDRIADFGGSWSFLILFGLIITIWCLVNTLSMINRPFDPYPFILLNLILSCLAAVQAPVF